MLIDSFYSWRLVIGYWLSAIGVDYWRRLSTSAISISSYTILFY